MAKSDPRPEVPEGIDVPTRMEMHRIGITEISTPAHALAFKMVDATCPDVDVAFANLQMGLLDLLHGAGVELDAAAVDHLFCLASRRVKSAGTEPLRRALVHACAQWIYNREEVETLNQDAAGASL